MTHFRFRLARVRKVRSIEEELARGDFLAAERSASLTESRLADIRALLGGVERDATRERSQGTLEPQRVLAAQAAMDDLRDSERTLRARAAQGRLEAEDARTSWKAARAKERSLGLLEERRRAEHSVEERWREQREIDEVALRRSSQVLGADDPSADDPTPLALRGPDPRRSS